MSEFRKGDKVRRINEDYRHMKIGNIYEFVGYVGDGTHLIIKEHEYGVTIDNFELAENDSLDQLIEDVNKGFKAYHELCHNHKGELEINGWDNDRWHDHYENIQYLNNRVREVRKKVAEKPKFKAFSIDLGSVGIADHKLLIGCKDFDPQMFKKMLDNLCNGKVDNYCVQEKKKSITFSSTRKGIKLDTHNLSWEDADKILAELERCGY